MIQKLNLTNEFEVLELAGLGIVQDKIRRANLLLQGSTSEWVSYELEHDLALLQDLDSRNEHTPKWHQWGIISHSRMAHEFMFSELVHMDLPWTEIMSLMLETIDGVCKWELFQLSIPFHDVGKFASNMDPDFDYKPHQRDHDRHEVLSAEYVLDTSGVIYKHLVQSGYTHEQIEYVAALCAKHYELGKFRKVGKASGVYSLEKLHTTEFETALASVVSELGSYDLEIALWYAIDSMAKVDPKADLSALDFRANTSERMLKDRQLNVSVALKAIELVLSSKWY